MYGIRKDNDCVLCRSIYETPGVLCWSNHNKEIYQFCKGDRIRHPVMISSFIEISNLLHRLISVFDMNDIFEFTEE